MAKDAGAPTSLPMEGRLKRIALGSDSDGPILTAWSPEGSNVMANSARFSLVALDTLKVLKVGAISRGGFQGLATVSESGGSFTLHPFLGVGTLIRASAGGGLFALWNTTASPSGFQTLRLQGHDLAAIYNHDALGYLAPGPDGRTIYTLGGGRRDPDGKVIGKAEDFPEPTLPTSDPAYFLTLVKPNKAGPRTYNQPSTPPNSATIRATGDGSLLFTIDGIEEVFPKAWDNAFEKSDFTIEKRFHVIPRAKLLVTIPASNDRLVLRRFDVEEALSKLEGDYLFILSPTILQAKLGQTLEHRIVAKSKSGKVTFNLADGPEGLKVEPDGKVTFAVPKTLDKGEATAVITVSDDSGQERFHKLTIRAN